MTISNERYDELIHAIVTLNMIEDLLKEGEEKHENESEMLAGIRFLLGYDSGSRVD